MVSPRAGWWAALVLALCWSMLPLAPAILSGAIPGQPYTDLYPSLWGLGWFARHWAEVLPTYAPELRAPEGMPFYYSSPLHGWLAAPLQAFVTLRWNYIVGLIGARVATVLCSYGAARALQLTPAGALVMAAIYGCSPFFHGYAVEGIIEGVDGWGLPLWMWLAARQKWTGAVAAAALTVASSWYMAWSGCLVAIAWAWWRPRESLTFLGGVVVAAPLIVAFSNALSGGVPLEPEVRAAMGTAIIFFPPPGVLEGLHPFAKTSWIGWLSGTLALLSVRRHPRWAAALVLGWVLSLGVGPWYELPVWRSIRFPYRLHAAVLIALGFLAARTAEHTRIAPILALLIIGEALLLSPIEPVLPSSSAEVPITYRDLRGQVVLSVPGPLAMPPGQVNLSRRRARYVLYYAEISGTHTPWAPDFNGLSNGESSSEVLRAVRSWDPLLHGGQDEVSPGALREAGIDALVVHEDELGGVRAAKFNAMLQRNGAHVRESETGLWVVTGW